MSAFLCSPEHIGALANYYIAQSQVHRNKTATDVAEILARANLASVSYRYEDLSDPDKAAEGFLGMTADAYVTECKRQALWHPKPISNVAAYKMAQCLDYQSCEVPNWLGSEAERLIDGIKDTAVRSMPGYDEAPWELTYSQAALV